MNLHQITVEYQELLNMGFDEDSQVFIDTLDSIKQSIQEKGQNIALVLNKWDMQSKAIDDEIKRLQARKKTRANNIASLKNWLKMNMQKSGIDKIESDLFTITLSKAPKNNVVLIEDEKEVPKEYQVEKWTMNKTAIKQALKDGYVVKGARLIDGQRSLRIK